MNQSGKPQLHPQYLAFKQRQKQKELQRQQLDKPKKYIVIKDNPLAKDKK